MFGCTVEVVVGNSDLFYKYVYLFNFSYLSKEKELVELLWWLMFGFLFIQNEPEFRPPMSEIVQDLASMVRPSREPSKWQKTKIGKLFLGSF